MLVLWSYFGGRHCLHPWMENQPIGSGPLFRPAESMLRHQLLAYYAKHLDTRADNIVVQAIRPIAEIEQLINLAISLALPAGVAPALLLEYRIANSSGAIALPAAISSAAETLVSESAGGIADAG